MWNRPGRPDILRAMRRPNIPPVAKTARKIGIDPERLIFHGPMIAKVPVDELERRKGRKDGELILVTAMNPTPHGEGKTTTTIGLGDALARLGLRTAVCLREPSLGPYFGIKGGGTGAGRARLVPAEDINLHFVGDMYAVEKSNNLLAAMADNHLQHGNELGLDPRRIVLQRVIDLNDRALREIVIGLGGPAHGVPRKDGFSITPASEVMAVLCLAKDYRDLGRRLGRMVVGFRYDGRPVLASELRAVGAMQVLLRDAIHPNLVQTAEGTPAFVHGGPFANIAQGTNSALATRLALKCAEVVVTEAGFGSDLGAEKFFDIKCRTAGLRPTAAVIVATRRAVEWHGGERGGLDNLAKHIENIRLFGLEPVVCLNRFADDREGDLRRIVAFCERQGVRAVVADHYRRGGAGAIGLARAVLESARENRRRTFRPLYPLSLPLDEKVRTVAERVYGAEGVRFDKEALEDLAMLERNGYGGLAVCVAKTPLSLSDDPSLRGRPSGFTLTVNRLKVSAGAGFVVAVCGHVMTMPGLPKVPAAARIRVLPDGRTVGLT